MNNNDLRVQLPLWNIALMVILMIWSYGIVYSVDVIFNEFEGVYDVVGNSVIINWNLPGILSIIIGFFFLIIFFIAYSIKLKKHNKKNPNRKIPFITFLKPGELLEDDEMLRQVTRNATQKVYILYSHTIPLLICLMFFPLDRYLIISLLFLLIIIHNVLYYLEIRKFMKGEYSIDQSSDYVRTASKNKLQRYVVMVILGVLIIIVSTVVIRILQIESNHKENISKAESCLDNGGTVVFEENGLFGVSKVSCEDD
ncbi:hypothetical protein [Virgibacillus sp. MG-45]|uniref:hypothetical protein n=1 Tax=Virgibacillus sp. MG-45 TaxID=3102791 RepID=UPI002EDAC226